MEIVIHGTKGGYKVLYQTPGAPFSIARDVRRIDRNDGNTVGQTAYAIAWINGGCAFTKYIVVRDIERAAIGNVAFSVYIPGHRKMDGHDVKMLLDKLAEEYCRNYVIEGSLGNKQEDWAFVSKLLGQYEKYCYPEKEVMENYRQGIGEAAYIYYSAIELQKYFDYPCQEAYKPYMQIFFVERQYEHTSQDPLNSLRHDSDANLTGKVIPENRRKVLEPPRYEKGNNKNVGEVNRGQRGNEIGVNKGSKSELTGEDKRRGRFLKKWGLCGGIVLVVLGIIGVVIGVLNKDTDPYEQLEEIIKTTSSLNTLYSYKNENELVKCCPKIREKNIWFGLGKAQKDSTKYKKWEKLNQRLDQAIRNLKAEAYLSGTELFYSMLEYYENFVTDRELLDRIKRYKDFRKKLDGADFTGLIDSGWAPIYTSQERFRKALNALEKNKGTDGKNERERARDMINHEFGNIAIANLDQIADIMEKVHKQKGNGKKKEEVNYSKPQEELCDSDKRIREKIQDCVKVEDLNGLEQQTQNRNLKACIDLYRKFWNSKGGKNDSYKYFLNRINSESNLSYLKDSCLQKALEDLVADSETDYKDPKKKKALDKYKK